MGQWSIAVVHAAMLAREQGHKLLVVGRHRVLGRIRHELRHRGIASIMASFHVEDHREDLEIYDVDESVILCEHQYQPRVHGDATIVAYESRPTGRWRAGQLEAQAQSRNPCVVLAHVSGRVQLAPEDASGVVAAYTELGAERAARLCRSPALADEEAGAKRFVDNWLDWRDTTRSVADALASLGLAPESASLGLFTERIDWETRREAFANEKAERSLARPNARHSVCELLALDPRAPDPQIKPEIVTHNLVPVGVAELVRALLDPSFAEERDRREDEYARRLSRTRTLPAAERKNIVAKRNVLVNVLAALGTTPTDLFAGAPVTVGPEERRAYVEVAQRDPDRWCALFQRVAPKGASEQAASKSIRSLLALLGVVHVGADRLQIAGKREVYRSFAASRFVVDLARRAAGDASATEPAPAAQVRKGAPAPAPGFVLGAGLSAALDVLRAGGTVRQRQRLTSYVAAIGPRAAGYLLCPPRSDWWREPSGRLHVGGLRPVPGTSKYKHLGPQIQNVSGDLRHFFAAAPGRSIVNFDAATFHFQVAARLTQDPALLALVRDGDAYQKFATLLGITREVAKKVALALLNGSEGRALIDEGIDPVTAWRLPVAWKRAFPVLAAQVARWRAEWRKAGGWVTAYGERVFIPPHKAKTIAALKWVEIEAAMLDCVINAIDARGTQIGLRVLLPLYDGLVADVPTQHAAEAENLIAAAFREVCPWGTPKVGTGATWGAAEDATLPR